jgi:hypothetical protein
MMSFTLFGITVQFNSGFWLFMARFEICDIMSQISNVQKENVHLSISVTDSLPGFAARRIEC